LPSIAPGIDWKTSSDELSVLLCILPVARQLSPDEVTSEFLKAGFRGDLDREALVTALEKPSEEWRVVLSGKPWVDPVDGWIEYLVDPEDLDRSAVETERGRVDYKSLKLFLNVEKGRELARIHPPIPGGSGMDVYGKTIPAREGHPARLMVGEGVGLQEDGQVAVALEDGAVVMREGRISVVKIFTISGDTSYKTGNINFNGSIDVGRDVLTGFSLKATGDILVRGTVEGATLEAKGDIHVLGGFLAGGRGKMVAGGSIWVRYAEDGTLECGNSLIVKSHILNCKVRAGQEVLVESLNGTIAGGEICAEKRIAAPHLGNEAGVKTCLHIGLDHDLPTKIESAKEIIAALMKLRKPYDHRTSEVEAMQAELDAIRNGEVAALTSVKPGVVVRFPGAEELIQDPLGKLAFRFVEGKIEKVITSAGLNGKTGKGQAESTAVSS
jgi:uncharacterized protein (DUF342 family)